MTRSALLLALGALAACESPPPAASSGAALSGAPLSDGAASAVASSVGATSTDSSRRTISITDAYGPAAPAGGTGALYLTIAGGPEGDTLLAARVPGAARTALHEAFDAGDGMRGMRAVAGVPVPARSTVALAPGGTHAMLMGLTAALAPGDTLDATLTFARAGTVRVRAAVLAPADLPAAPSPPSR